MGDRRRSRCGAEDCKGLERVDGFWFPTWSCCYSAAVDLGVHLSKNRPVLLSPLASTTLVPQADTCSGGIVNTSISMRLGRWLGAICRIDVLHGHGPVAAKDAQKS
jgi:hypothetical protein